MGNKTSGNEQTRQHHRLATGDESVASENRGTQTKFAKGGAVQQRDTTEFQKYGSGYRKKK